MQKINFQNLPNTTTPVNATNLNQLQTNVENEFTNGTVYNATRFNNRQDKISQTFTAASGSWIPIIDLNGDIEHTTIGALIATQDSGWIQLNSYVQYRKVSNIVFVEVFCGDGSFTINGDTIVGNLPSGYRPSTRIDFTYHQLSGTDTSAYGYITDYGDIHMGNNGNNNIRWFGGNISFPAA